MPGVSKSVKYQKEQNEIIDKLFNLLPLDEDNSFFLYNLDQNTEIHKQIIDMIPDIKKYFNINNMKSVQNPNNKLRPWLCIIRSILKLKYTIFITDSFVKINDNPVKTRKYTFLKKSS